MYVPECWCGHMDIHRLVLTFFHSFFLYLRFLYRWRSFFYTQLSIFIANHSSYMWFYHMNVLTFHEVGSYQNTDTLELICLIGKNFGGQNFVYFEYGIGQNIGRLNIRYQGFIFYLSISLHITLLSPHIKHSGVLVTSQIWRIDINCGKSFLQRFNKIKFRKLLRLLYEKLWEEKW